METSCDGDVPRRPSYGVYISQPIRFARVCCHVEYFNARNKCLTAKLLKHDIISLERRFPSFIADTELVSKFNVRLKSLLNLGLLEPNLYGDLVYKFKTIKGRTDYSDQFLKLVIRHKRTGYELNVVRQSACFVINPIIVDSFADL